MATEFMPSTLGNAAEKLVTLINEAFRFVEYPGDDSIAVDTYDRLVTLRS